MSARRPRVLACIVGVLVYAGFAWASGLDRASIGHPGLARLVPGNFRAESAHLLAAQALAAGKYRNAKTLAEVAIDAVPSDRRGLGLYATALLMGGNRKSASEALAVARRAGMRDPLVLAYGVTTAFERGDFETSANELEALLRTAPQLPQAETLFDALASSPHGRAALARTIEGDRRWAGRAFETWPAPAARLLADREAFEAPLGCETARPVVARLLASGDHAAAAEIWHGHCQGGVPADLVSDPDFARLARSEESDPFGWRRVPSGDVSVSALPDGGLQISNRSAVARRALEQPVDLRPGSYRMNISGDSAGLDLLLDCAADRGRAEARRRSAGGVVSVDAGCSGQMLAVWVAPGISDARIDAVRIEAY